MLGAITALMDFQTALLSLTALAYEKGALGENPALDEGNHSGGNRRVTLKLSTCAHREMETTIQKFSARICLKLQASS
jgi:hypothetical protein